VAQAQDHPYRSTRGRQERTSSKMADNIFSLPGARCAWWAASEFESPYRSGSSGHDRVMIVCPGEGG
jgi:hypothetical protein